MALTRESHISDGSLSGRFTHLRPINPGDYPHLFEIATHNAVSPSWRFRATSVSYEEFVARLYENVLAQFVIEGRTHQETLGHVIAYAPDHRNQYCYLGVVLSPDRDRMMAIEGALVMLVHLFRCFPLRKVYAEVPGFNMKHFQSGVGRILHEEGRLREHSFHAGRWWDQHLLAIYPQDVERYAARFLVAEDGA